MFFSVKSVGFEAFSLVSEPLKAESYKLNN